MKEMRSLLVRLYGYIKVRQQLGVIGVILLSTLIGMAIPWFMQIFIDDVIGDRQIKLLPLMGLGLMTFTLAQSAMEFVQSFVIARIGEQTARRVRKEIYTQAASLDHTTRMKYKSGNMISLFNNDVSQVYGFISSFASGIVAQTLLLVMLIAALLIMNVKLTVLAVLTVPLYFIAFSFLGKRLQNLARNRQQAYVSLNTQLQEDLTGMSTFQILRATGAKANAFDGKLTLMMKNNVRLSLVLSSLNQVASLVAGLGNVVVLWAGTWMVIRGETTIGQLMAFSAYMGRLYGPILSIVSINQMFQTALPSLQRIFSFLDLKNRIVDRPDAAPLQGEPGDIRLADVSFHHEDGKPVLDHVDLTIRQGEFTAIVGESGSGKSTIVSLLVRTLEPIEGSILINGAEYRSYTMDSIRSRIGLAEQSAGLFSETVRENIAIGANGISDQQLRQALYESSAEFVYQLPEGLDTRVDERGSNLSGGERQRLTLSRVLVRDYGVLLLDEPTASLDPISGAALIGRIRQKMKGKTLVVISHRLEDVQQADRIYVMHQGKVMGSGRHQELYEGNDYYRKLYDAQAAPELVTASA